MLYEAFKNGGRNPDYASCAFNKVPGSCSLQALLRHYSLRLLLGQLCSVGDAWVAKFRRLAE